MFLGRSARQTDYAKLGSDCWMSRACGGFLVSQCLSGFLFSIHLVLYSWHCLDIVETDLLKRYNCSSCYFATCRQRLLWTKSSPHLKRSTSSTSTFPLLSSSDVLNLSQAYSPKVHGVLDCLNISWNKIKTPFWTRKMPWKEFPKWQQRTQKSHMLNGFE